MNGQQTEASNKTAPCSDHFQLVVTTYLVEM